MAGAGSIRHDKEALPIQAMHTLSSIDHQETLHSSQTRSIKAPILCLVSMKPRGGMKLDQGSP